VRKATAVSFQESLRARPACQKQHVGFGQLTLAIAPGNFLDDNGAAVVASDVPHGIQQEDEKPPKRDELETPLGELVVTGRRMMAARTDRGRTLARPHCDFDALFVRTKAGMPINEPPEMMAVV